MSPPAASADGFSDDLVNIWTRHYIRKTGTIMPRYRPLAFKYQLLDGNYILALIEEWSTRV
jgi:hypothetical protein